ncbi:sugar ABC transporter permease [Ruminiclostridium cellobioparum]|jgi:arabinogalactan oligomer/maltooligosaccharide transport system permease protein|uniref:sugar ABC transporter permease n=1 Tax=Ruminiclostridium cellobioparum TaxID=29355 RepID=UPI0005587181|nr:sugar ABC transporter permease [Ruminiclostridium cellobioparum]
MGRNDMNRGDKRTLLVSRIIIWVVILLTLFPAFWILMASFSKGDSFFMTSLLPDNIGGDNYVELFRETDFLLWVFNSLKLCFFVAIIQLFLTCTAAYAFSRMRFPGRKNGLKTLLVLQVFPSSMALAGYYIIIYRFGLVDNMLFVILVLSGGSAFNIWLLKSFIDNIPKELDEAAFVDGAGYLQIFMKIILPLAVPQIIVIFLFSFIGTYSEFVISSVFLQSPDKHTLAIGLQTFITNQFAAHWTLFAAAAVVSSLPVMFIFMMLQRYIQNGLAAGGVKE